VSEENEQTPEQERQSAEAAFAATTEAPVEAEAEIKAVEAPKEEVKEADPWDGVSPVLRQTIEGINSKLGKIDALTNEVKAGTGRIAAMQREMASAQAAAKVVEVAPTQSQISEASKNPDNWKNLKDTFPEWATELDERFAAERAELLKQMPAVDVDGIKRDVSASMSEAIKQSEVRVTKIAREFARVDLKYENWEVDVRAPEFAAWTKAQAPEIQALAESNNARDAIKMLDMYYDHRKIEEARAKKTARLEAAIPAKGTNSQRQPTESDRDAAEKAFASA
jgi:hypothetical protein